MAKTITLLYLGSSIFRIASGSGRSSMLNNVGSRMPTPFEAISFTNGSIRRDIQPFEVSGRNVEFI